MIDYLNPGKTTTGQYYAEPTFKLLEVVKQKQWRKLSLGSWTFSWQCTSGAQQALGNCESVQLKHPAYNLDLAPSNYFLIRNLKYRLRGTWFIVDESLKIAAEAWSESKQKIRFSRHKQLRTKVENMQWCCVRICPKNDSMCDIIC